MSSSLSSLLAALELDDSPSSSTRQQPEQQLLHLTGTQSSAISCDLHFHCKQQQQQIVCHLITQSRLLVHPDVEHESIVEELEDSYDDDDDDDDDDDSRRPSQHQQQNIHRVLICSWRRDAHRDDNQQSKSSRDLLHQSAVLLLAGDRGAGKTTLSAIASGLSLATQRVLKLHATALANVWFDPSPQDMRYFASEISPPSAAAAAATSSASSSSQCANRRLPLLPSQLCITSLYGLTEEIAMFVSDDALTEEAAEAGLERVSLSSADADAHARQHQHLHFAADPAAPVYSSLRMVEVGGDLLETMMMQQQQQQQHVKNEEDDNDSTSSTVLIRSATSAVHAATSAAYFFDASKVVISRAHVLDSMRSFFFFLSVVGDETTSAKRLLLVASRAAATETSRDHNDDDDAEEEDDRDAVCVSCRRELLSLFAEAKQTCLLPKSTNSVEAHEPAARLCCAGKRSFLQLLLRKAAHVVPECSNGKFSCSGAVIVPDFSANNNAFSANSFGHLEDSCMEILRLLTEQGISAAATPACRSGSTRINSSSFFFHPVQVASSARVARLLNAVLVYSLAKLWPKWLSDQQQQQQHQQADESLDHLEKEFLQSQRVSLTLRSCSQALKFVAKNGSSSNDDDSQKNHHHECACCQHHNEPSAPACVRSNAALLATTRTLPNKLLGPISVSNSSSSGGGGGGSRFGSVAIALSRTLEYSPDSVVARAVPFLLERLHNEHPQRISRSTAAAKEEAAAVVVRPLCASLADLLDLHDLYEREALLTAFCV